MGRWGGGGHPAASACSLRLSEVEEVAVQGAQAEARANARAGAEAGAEGRTEAADPEAQARDDEEMARDDEVAKRALVEMEEAAYRYLAQGLQQVIAQLPAQKTATELMTKTVYCVAPDDSMEEARLKMLRVNKKSTPVVDADGKFEGTLKYNAVVKAAKAGKGAQMVKAWMRREGVTVAPDTPFDDLERVMESEVCSLDSCSHVLPCTHGLLAAYCLLPTTCCLLLAAYLLCTGGGAAAGGLWRRQAARPRYAHRRAEGAQAVRERRGHRAEARPMRAARGACAPETRSLGRGLANVPGGSRRLQGACEGL